MSSWGLQQLPVLGSPGSASRKLVPSSHPLDSQLLHRSKKPLAALNYGSPSQAASGVAVLPTVLIACLILPLGTFPTQVRGRREEAALLCDLQLQLPDKPLHWQRIKGAGQGTKSIDSNEWIQLHLIYFIFFTRQRWQWQSIFVSSITCAMHASEMHHFSCFFQLLERVLAHFSSRIVLAEAHISFVHLWGKMLSGTRLEKCRTSHMWQISSL